MDFLTNFLSLAEKLSNDDLNILLSDPNISIKFVCFAWEKTNTRDMLTIRDLCQIYLRPKYTRLSLFNMKDTAFTSYTYTHELTFHRD